MTPYICEWVYDFTRQISADDNWGKTLAALKAALPGVSFMANEYAGQAVLTLGDSGSSGSMLADDKAEHGYNTRRWLHITRTVKRLCPGSKLVRYS